MPFDCHTPPLPPSYSTYEQAEADFDFAGFLEELGINMPNNTSLADLPPLITATPTPTSLDFSRLLDELGKNIPINASLADLPPLILATPTPTNLDFSKLLDELHKKIRTDSPIPYITVPIAMLPLLQKTSPGSKELDTTLKAITPTKKLLQCSPLSKLLPRTQSAPPSF